MTDGFLGRWAKRKEAVRQGEEVAPEAGKGAGVAHPQQPAPASGKASLEPALPLASDGDARLQRPTPVEAAPPSPTLEEANALTPESDFTRFTARDVDPSVKNAAMKKLFADPHFNRMDGLDV